MSGRNPHPDRHRRYAEGAVHEAFQALEDSRRHLWEQRPEAALLSFATAMTLYGQARSEAEHAVQPELVERAQTLGQELAGFAARVLPAGFAATRTPTTQAGVTLEWADGWRWPDIENAVYRWALERYGGLRQAAEALGLPRNTLRERIERVESALAGGAYRRRRRGATPPGKNPEQRFDWNGRPFRKADRLHDYGAVWYGPDGPDGDIATQVEPDGGGYRVSEYTNIEAEIEDAPRPFLCTSAHVERHALHAAVRALTPHGEEEVARMREDSELEERYAAGLGVAQLAHLGGDETFVDDLP